MGVGGLLTQCLEHRDECIDTYNLVQVAQARGGIELLVDFYSFQQFVVPHLWNSLSNVTNNSMLRVLGGEYRIIADVFRKIADDLKDLQIQLVLFIDGAKGSCKVTTQQKLDTWKYRHRQSMEKMQKLCDVIQGETTIKDLPDDVSIRPVLIDLQVVTSLKAAGCEVIECPTGEADYVIAKSLVTRPKAFAVLSNDSDFAIFKGCLFVPHQLFDTENDLCLGKDQVLPSKPSRLMVGAIRAEKVGPMLGLETHDQLVELSIIAGNDFTSPFLRGQLRGKYDLNGRKLSEAVSWVKKYRRVENHPVIKQFMKRNHEFAERVIRSRQFYCIEDDAQQQQQQQQQEDKHYLTQFIEDQIRNGNYPGHIISMHLRFYWYRMLLEDSTPGSMSCEEALMDLRSHIYSLVLKQVDNTVIEYGRGPDNHIITRQVQCSRMRGLPQVTAVDPTKIFQNLRTFCRIMTHYEPRFQPKYIERYGRKTGFLLYVLRYFLNLHVGYNLYVDLNEMLALAAMTLGRIDPRWYQSLPIMPSLRSVIIGNMFQDVYRHAYMFLGSLLHLKSEFPEPWEVFSGSVFTAFYITGQQRNDMLRNGMPVDVLRRIEQDRMNVIHQNRHMLEKLFDGFFHFHMRF